MRQFTVKVTTPRNDFEYSTITVPRKGEDVSIGNYIYTVLEVCHMLDEYQDSSGTFHSLSYVLVRAV